MQIKRVTGNEFEVLLEGFGPLDPDDAGDAVAILVEEIGTPLAWVKVQHKQRRIRFCTGDASCPNERIQDALVMVGRTLKVEPGRISADSSKRRS